MDKVVVQWLGDYVLMMEANLGFLADSKVQGLYDSIVERVIDVRSYLRQRGYEVSRQPDSASGGSDHIDIDVPGGLDHR